MFLFSLLIAGITLVVAFDFFLQRELDHFVDLRRVLRVTLTVTFIATVAALTYTFVS